jgi:hypothetical protein
MKNMPFGSPPSQQRTDGVLESYLKTKQIPGGFTPSLPYAQSIDTSLAERVEKLEARVSELEKKNSMAAWHLSQFCVVNMPSLRSQLELRGDFVPSHIAAAMRHLSDGIEPKPAEIRKAIRRR